MFARSLLFALLVAFVSAIPATRRQEPGVNDFNCKSSTQPFPVVLIHGLGANKDNDLRGMQSFLAQKGFCTFAITYGATPQNPFNGGLRPIPDSSKQLSDYINTVASRTGAKKVDLVGHSEGGFMTLYVPKFHPFTRKLVRKSFAIAPPSHGTTLSGLVTLAKKYGTSAAIDGFLAAGGCQACVDLEIGSPVIKSLEKGGITQKGIQYTVITSKFDEIVTPVPDASYVREAGVRNFLIQDVCPLDPVGHLAEGFDPNVWNLVLNELQDQQGRRFVCVAGVPVKRTSTTPLLV